MDVGYTRRGSGIGPVRTRRIAAGHALADDRSVLMARFSDQMVTEVVQRFWAAMQRGEFITDAAAEAGTYRKKGARWLAAAGGVRPRRGRDLKGRCLTFSEREEIALGRAGGESIRLIAGRLGRSPSTVSRELRRNAGCSGQAYRATTAHALAYERAGRVRNPPSWPRTWRYAGRSRMIYSAATRRSRSSAGCAASSRTIPRCECRPRRSTSRCTCSPAERCAVI